MDFKASKLSGMWVKTSKASGKKFIVGDFTREALMKLLADVNGDRFSLMIFSNTKRPGRDNDPDYTAHLVEREDRPKWPSHEPDDDGGF